MRLIPCFLAPFLAITASNADDWPQLLGPMRNNKTTEVIPAWKTPPSELWRRSLGEGNSNAIVTEGKIFLHTKTPDQEAEEVTALDANTGALLWHASYPRSPYTSTTGSGPRSTPAAALGRIVTHGVTGMLTCYSADTGEQLWQHDTHRKFGIRPLRYGVTSSPLIEANRVLIHLGAPHAAVAAFDLDTGDVLWTALDDSLATSSPVPIVTEGGRRQIVFHTAIRIVGLDTLSGEVLWEHPVSQIPVDSVAAPFWADKYLISSSVAFGGKAVRVSEDSGMFRAVEAWRNPELGAYFQSGVPCAEKGCYFIVTNRQEPGATLRCVDLKTGSVRWSRPGVADWHAGLMGTGDGKMLLSDGQGVLRLLDTDPDKYVELASTQVEGMPSSVNPVVADGRIYLRDKERIVCLRGR